MRLTRTLHVYVSLVLVLFLVQTSARDAPSDVAGKGLSPRPTAVPAAPTSAAAPTSIAPPVSACVIQCIEGEVKKGTCGILDANVCFCTKLTAATLVQSCVRQSCPPSDEASLVQIFTQKCIGVGSSLPLSSLFSLPFGPSQAPSTSAPVSAPSSKAASGTQSPPSASPAASATETPASESKQHTTAATAPSASQSDATPVPTLGVSPPPSDPRGSISTDVDGVQVTLTITDSAGAAGTALNPPTNNARRTGRGVLSTSIFVVIAVYIL